MQLIVLYLKIINEKRVVVNLKTLAATAASCNDLSENLDKLVKNHLTTTSSVCSAKVQMQLRV